jgi:hypothetical protein
VIVLRSAARNHTPSGRVVYYYKWPLLAGGAVHAMQKLMLAVTAIAALALFAPMSAVEGQSNSEPAIARAPRTVNLTAEQRFIIKEIVYKDLNVPRAQAGAPESIGDQVPPNVELHEMTAELGKKVPEAKSHKFYVTADAIVLVSPSDRRVADVIK